MGSLGVGDPLRLQADPDVLRSAGVEAVILRLQTDRVEFISAVMALRYAPVSQRDRRIRRAVVRFIRLQRTLIIAAKVTGI